MGNFNKDNFILIWFNLHIRASKKMLEMTHFLRDSHIYILHGESQDYSMRNSLFRVSTSFGEELERWEALNPKSSP